MHRITLSLGIALPHVFRRTSHHPPDEGNGLGVLLLTGLDFIDLGDEVQPEEGRSGEGRDGGALSRGSSSPSRDRPLGDQGKRSQPGNELRNGQRYSHSKLTLAVPNPPHLGTLGTETRNLSHLGTPGPPHPPHLGTPGTMGALGTTAAHCMRRSNRRGARSLNPEARTERHTSRAALTVFGT